MHTARAPRVAGAVVLAAVAALGIVLGGCGSSSSSSSSDRSTRATTTPARISTTTDDTVLTKAPPPSFPWDLGPVHVVTFEPVLNVIIDPCGDRGVVERGGIDGKTCYLVGPAATIGRALKSARAVRDGNDPKRWNVLVTATTPPDAQLAKLFDACYRAAPTCPARAGAQHGAVAIVADDYVVSAPAVVAPGLAAQDFTIALGFTEQQARAVASAFGP